jgi:uncharacterized protein YggU (UPF0235/DUF167 family)
MGALPWREAAGGFFVRFRLTPKSSKDAIEGPEMTADGPAFKARVRAVPEDGAANAALEKLVAAWLGVPKSAVRLVSGGKSRVKTVAVEGDPAAIAVRLAARFDALEG